MKRLFSVWVALMVMLFVGSAMAQDSSETGEDAVVLDEMVVTASRLEESVSSVPANVTVVTADDIVDSTARDVADLLRTEAGIHASDITGVGRDYTVDLRGFGETAPLNTVVLVDGRRVNQADLSGTDWTQIPIEQVARIEVIRGGRASVFYGDNAAGGVINIITKKGEGNEVGGEVQVGSYNAYKVSAYANGLVDAFSYAFSGNYSDTDGYRDNSGNEMEDFGADLGYEVNDMLAVNVSSGYHENTAGYPGAIRESQFEAGVSRTDSLYPDDFSEFKDYYVKAAPEIHFLTNSTATMDVSYRERTTYYYSSWDGGYSVGDNKILTLNVNPKVSIRENLFGFDHSLNMGVDYTDVKEDVANELYSDYFGYIYESEGDFELKKENYGLYIHDELAVTPEFSASAGFRYDSAEYSLYGTGTEADNFGWYSAFTDGSPAIEYDESLFTAGVNYKLNATSNAYLSYSRSYRYPVLDEFFSYRTNSFNVLLAPQTASDYEIGLRYAFDSGTRVGVNLFYVKTEDEIFYDPYYLAWGENVNMDGDTVRQGMELNADRYFQWGQLGLQYTYTDTEINGGTYDGGNIPNVPKHQYGFNALVNYWKPFTLALNGQYVGKRLFISDWYNTWDEQDAYFVMNAKLKYEWRNVTAFMNINNLLDEEYSEYGALSIMYNERGYYPSPERNFLAGVSVNF